MTWFGKSFQILLPAQTHMLQFKKKKEEEGGGGRNQALKERVGYRNQLVKHFYIHN